MVHICADEIGMIGAVIASVGAMFKPVRDCIKCQAIYLYNKLKRK